jgi:hypothetical protein
LLDSVWLGRRAQHREMMASAEHALPHCEALTGVVSTLGWAKFGAKAAKEYSIVVRATKAGRDLGWVAEPRVGI